MVGADATEAVSCRNNDEDAALFDMIGVEAGEIRSVARSGVELDDPGSSPCTKLCELLVAEKDDVSCVMWLSCESSSLSF